MGTRMSIPAPGDFVLPRDACSYGYFLLAPNRWNPLERTLTRPLLLEGGVATLTISQDGAERDPVEGEGGRLRWSCEGNPLAVRADRALSRRERGEARAMLVRMLRLDDETTGEFHGVDARWARSGRGRLFRSPTFFEDLIKTVTSCNVAWPSTMRMNQRLCEVVAPAFPTSAQLARKKASTLRARCSVGYRDARLVRLAKMHAAGEIDEGWLADPGVTDEEVFRFLKGLPGLGPYSAANVMQLLGRYERLPIDTETMRHARTVLGYEGTDAELWKRVESHYAPFGARKFQSYWFELWDFYEARRGPAWTWDPATTGKTFTASALKEPAGDEDGPPPGVRRSRGTRRRSTRV